MQHVPIRPGPFAYRVNPPAFAAQLEYPRAVAEAYGIQLGVRSAQLATLVEPCKHRCFSILHIKYFPSRGTNAADSLRCHAGRYALPGSRKAACHADLSQRTSSTREQPQAHHHAPSTTVPAQCTSDMAPSPAGSVLDASP